MAPPSMRPKKEKEADDDWELRAAAQLMQLALCPGMAIEVYARPRFWAARVDAVLPDGFWYLFDGNDELGWCPRGTFLTHWRFPLDERRKFTRRSVRRLLASAR